MTVAQQHGGGHDSLAPVIPLFGAAGSAVSEPARWRSTWEDDGEGGIDDGDLGDGDEVDESIETEREIARQALLKKLRGRSLSVFEARAVARGRDLDPAGTDWLIESFQRQGYLDDTALAEQLVHAGVDRKGQGRTVIGQTLRARGIPREIADVALQAVPDDDAGRALEYARSKAHGFDRVDEQTAQRRLIGQLARRGYPGGVAATAARTALQEHRGGGGSGVRFR